MEPENLSLVALSPSDLPQAQSSLVEWCDRKIAHVQGIVEDLTKNLEIAKRNRWGSRQSLQTALGREEKRVLFYGKIKAAVGAGYLVVPNFPVDAFAVRVRPEEARRKAASYVSDDLTDVTPHLLSAGDGEYVDDKRKYDDNRWKSKDAAGKEQTHGDVSVREYNEEVDIPLVALKPVVLEAVERAMALKIFDRLGIVKQRKRDPIIVGQLLDPREKWPNSDQARMVTFFIAWWLNTDDL